VNIEDLNSSIDDSAKTQIVIDTLGVVPLNYTQENEKSKEKFQYLVSEEMKELQSELMLVEKEDDEKE
jgi:hypothetical protein